MGRNESTPPAAPEPGQRDWAACVITLDARSPRFRRFAEANSHLPFEPFAGVRGADIPDDQRIASGLATPELVASGLLTHGAAGCAASHRRLWEQVSATGRGMLVMEDDVVTHPGLADFVDRQHPMLAQATITYLGVNTDSVLQVISPSGLALTALQDPKHPSPAWITEAFARTDPSRCELWRLLRSFGTSCYYISPHGAAALLGAVFPLSLETISVPLISDQWPCSAIDRALNRVYPAVPAFVTMPFLAYSPNVDSGTRPESPGQPG